MSNVRSILEWKRNHPILGSFREFNKFLEEGRAQVSSKEEYIDWKLRWGSLYKEISEAIRQLKSMRKQYRYEYRETGDRMSKRRVVIGDNPNHDSGAEWIRSDFSSMAKRMMQAREMAKEVSIKNKKANFEAAA